MNLEDKYPLIDKFIREEISDDELLELELLKKESVFSQEFDYRIQVAEAAKREGRKAIRSQFAKLDKSETPVKKLFPMHILKAVAAIGIILIGVYYLMKPLDQLSGNSELYASYYEKLPNKLVIIPRGEINESDSLEMTMIYYRSEQYDKAKEMINLIKNKNPNLDIYEAAIALEEGNMKLAQKSFIAISKNASHDFQEDALWYLGLINLKSDDIEAAKSIFEDLSQKNSYYGNKAKKLLEEF